MISRLLPRVRLPLPGVPGSAGRSGRFDVTGVADAVSTAERHFVLVPAAPRRDTVGRASAGAAGVAVSADVTTGGGDGSEDRFDDALGNRYSRIVRRSSSVRRLGVWRDDVSPDCWGAPGSPLARSCRALRAASRSASRARSRSCRSRALLQRDSPPGRSGTGHQPRGDGERQMTIWEGAAAWWLVPLSVGRDEAHEWSQPRTGCFWKDHERPGAR